jgi:hypothetical protein
MKNIKEGTIAAFFSVAFFVFTAFFFSAMSVHYINIAEFDFTATGVAIYLAVLCLAVTVLITKIISFFGHRVIEKLAVLFLALGVLVWIQANILPWNYGVLDGREIDWGGKKIYGYIDSVMWICGFVLAFAKSKFLYKNARTISVAFILIQAIFLTTTVYQAPNEPSFKSYTVLEDQKYNFSPDKNVVLIILDAFQTDIFHELINENPSYKDAFDGFTYYRNSLSGFPTTYPSVPLIMTGQFYENKIPMQDFIKEVYLGDSLPKLLKENGYEVDLYAIKNTVFYDESVASNFKKRSDVFINPREFLRFMTADVFKIVPHFTKKFVYNKFTKKQTEKSAYDQFFGFMDGMKTASVSADSEDKGIFKFYHLIGIHPPLTIDENFTVKEMEITRENIKKQGIAMVKAMQLFTENLKRIGVYDKSMIIIIGDHGFGTDINLGLYKSGLAGLPDGGKIEMRKKALAIPLALVKPFGASGEFKISDAPVSLIDIPITFAKALGVSGNLVGKSIPEIGENENRTRRFLFFDWNHEYWKLEKRYLPPTEEYFVTGFSWLDSSWRDSGGELIPPTIR